MGLDHNRSLSALRLTIGRWTTREDIDHAADQIITATNPLLPCPKWSAAVLATPGFAAFFDRDGGDD